MAEDAMLPIVRAASRRLGPHRELVITFLVVFARFEFALKKSGFLHNGAEASPNWDTFTNAAFEVRFAALPPTSVTHAIDELVACPPKKQIVKDGVLDWGTTESNREPRSAANLLLMVRRVRNNLFHGGKFPMEPVGGPERNVSLLNNCLVVLDHALTCAPENVRHAFEAE